MFLNNQWVRVPESPGQPDAPAAADAGLPPPRDVMTQRVIRVNVAQLLSGDARANIVVRPGDVIRVPTPEQGQIYLGGQVNRPGAFNMAHAFQSQLFATKGAVINLASIRSFTSAGNAAAYSTSKGAVMQFTKALAVEWGPHGVRVNAIAPGFIDTAFVPEAEKTPQREAAIISRTPLRRQGVPAELGPVAVFLVSDAASYVSGAILPVDGGYLAL